jgi:hypothetical protein
MGPVLVIFLALFVFKASGVYRMKALFQVSTANLLPWRKLSSIAVAAASAALAARGSQILIHVPLFQELVLTGVVFTATYVPLIWMFELRQDPMGMAISTRVSRVLRPLKVTERLAPESCVESPE